MMAFTHPGLAAKIALETLGSESGLGPERFEPLPIARSGALERFADLPQIARIFGKDIQRVFTACKRQESGEFRRRISEVEYDAYLQNA